MSGRRLSKRHALALGRLFDREIDGALLSPGLAGYPRRLGPKVAAELEARGLAMPLTVTVPMATMGSLVVAGHVLTHAGRFAYCEWASEQCSEEASA